jgi:DNA polymerase III alpha subunit
MSRKKSEVHPVKCEMKEHSNKLLAGCSAIKIPKKKGEPDFKTGSPFFCYGFNSSGISSPCSVQKRYAPG